MSDTSEDDSTKPRYNSRREALKFAVDNAWNLTLPDVATRTRGGGMGRPSRLYQEEEVEVVLLPSEPEEEANSVVMEDAPVAEEGVEVEAPAVLLSKTGRPKKPPKPPNTRVVIEVDQLAKFCDNFHCLLCGEGIELNVRTICLASTWSVSCKDEACNFVLHSPGPAATTIHVADNDNFERSSDYAVNVLYVLGFISMGDGCSEAARLLGLLGLPNTKRYDDGVEVLHHY
jgi:hypothetical protein